MNIKIRNLLAAFLAAGCVSAAAAVEPAMDFDRGFDINGALENASRAPVPVPAPGNLFSSFKASRDCKFFSFNANDPLVSPPGELVSYVFQTVCDSYQNGEHCYDRLVRTEKRDVTVALKGKRAALPWEKDVFSVCMEDTDVSVDVIEASHEYKIVKKPGAKEYVVEAIAKEKLKTAPDPAGILVDLWDVSAQPGGLELTLKDKWAAIYGKPQNRSAKPEKTRIKVTLKQDQPFWFDGVVLRKELSLDPADSYKVDFSQFSAEFNRPLEPGQKYYVQWEFAREGEISKGNFVNGGETPRVLFPPH